MNKVFEYQIAVVLPLTVVLALSSCEKTGPPSVTTEKVIYITQNYAMIGGNVSKDNGDDLTSRGVCWNTSGDPTINDNRIESGSYLGAYVSLMTNLEPDTKYFVRAYALNLSGTGYGGTIIFFTPKEISDADGNNYHSVITRYREVGQQEWMIENLKVTKYSNGDPISNASDGVQWANTSAGAFCSYGNDISNCTPYGQLYNWYAVNDSRKLCPSGWHVPTDAEWTSIITYLGGESVAGGKLKEDGTDHWKSPNTGATNEILFMALPGGLRSYDAAFNNISYYGYWWSATEISTTTAWFRQMSSVSQEMTRGPQLKNSGFSVRCLKDL